MHRILAVHMVVLAVASTGSLMAHHSLETTTPRRLFA